MSNFTLKVGGSSSRGMTEAISSILKKLDQKYLNFDGGSTAIIFDFIHRSNICLDGDHLEDLDVNYFFLQVFINSIFNNEISLFFRKDCFSFFEKILGDLSESCVIIVHDIEGTKTFYLREHKKSINVDM